MVDAGSDLDGHSAGVGWVDDKVWWLVEDPGSGGGDVADRCVEIG